MASRGLDQSKGDGIDCRDDVKIEYGSILMMMMVMMLVMMMTVMMVPCSGLHRTESSSDANLNV